MKAVPTLAEIAQDRARLEGLPFGALWALLIEAGSLHTAIGVALAPAMQTAVVAQGPPEGRALTIGKTV